MKQIPLLQGKALLIEMPNLKLITTIHKGLLVAGVNQKDVSSKCRRIDRGDVKGFLHLPPGNWHIIGMLSEVTEEQAEGLVEWNEVLQYYPDYSMDGLWNGDITALESLESAILAENWHFDNPYVNPGLTPSFELERFRAAQSRVLDRSRCLLLGREI